MMHWLRLVYLRLARRGRIMHRLLLLMNLVLVMLLHLRNRARDRRLAGKRHHSLV